MTAYSKKIAIIGAGFVGATVAYASAIKNLAAEIILIDINERKEEGEVMDIADSLSLMETGGVRGGDFQDARDADVIVITAGVNQKPGDTRLQLVATNKKILASIFESMGALQPATLVVIVSNPVDVLTSFAQQLSGLPPAQVFGSGTLLDSSRLKTALSQHLKISPHSIQAYVLGEHGDSEFVAWSSVTVGGTPLSQLNVFSEPQLREIEEKVKKEAYEIIARKGATYYGIGLAVSEILEAVMYDQHRILPLSWSPDGWQGVTDVCLGVPVVLGSRGVEKVWPLPLTPAEQELFKKSAETLRAYLV